MPKKLTLDQVLNKFNKIHNNKYNYIKINYINSSIKIEINKNFNIWPLKLKI